MSHVPSAAAPHPVSASVPHDVPDTAPRPTRAASPHSTGSTALRVARRLARKWWHYLGGALFIAALIIALRFFDFVVVVGEASDTWWGITSVATMSMVITTIIFSAGVPALYLRPAYAAGATRTAMVLAWALVTPLVLATGALSILAVDLLSGVLARSGFGWARPDPNIIIDLGPGLPQTTLAASITVFLAVALITMVVLPTAIVLFRRLPWWVAVPVVVLAAIGLGAGAVTLGRGGLSAPDVLAGLVVVGLVALAGALMLRSTPIRPAMDTP